MPNHQKDWIILDPNRSNDFCWRSRNPPTKKCHTYFGRNQLVEWWEVPCSRIGGPSARSFSNGWRTRSTSDIEASFSHCLGWCTFPHQTWRAGTSALNGVFCRKICYKWWITLAMFDYLWGSNLFSHGAHASWWAALYGYVKKCWPWPTKSWHKQCLERWSAGLC